MPTTTPKELPNIWGSELFAEDSRYRSDGYTILRTDLCLRTPRRHAQVHMKPDEAAETWFQTHQNHLDTGSALRGRMYTYRQLVHADHMVDFESTRGPSLVGPLRSHKPTTYTAINLLLHGRYYLPRVRAMAWAVGPTATYIPIQLSPRQQPVLLAIVDGTVAAGLMTMLQR